VVSYHSPFRRFYAKHAAAKQACVPCHDAHIHVHVLQTQPHCKKATRTTAVALCTVRDWLRCISVNIHRTETWFKKKLHLYFVLCTDFPHTVCPRRKRKYSERSQYRSFEAKHCICTCALFPKVSETELFHYTGHCTDEQNDMSSRELRNALMLTVDFSKMY
jgi:hypothetical protein